MCKFLLELFPSTNNNAGFNIKSRLLIINILLTITHAHTKAIEMNKETLEHSMKKYTITAIENDSHSKMKWRIR